MAEDTHAAPAAREHVKTTPGSRSHGPGEPPAVRLTGSANTKDTKKPQLETVGGAESQMGRPKPPCCRGESGRVSPLWRFPAEKQGLQV